MSKTKRNFMSKVVADKDMKKAKPDGSCANHGSCPVCEGNRTFNSKRRAPDATYFEEDTTYA